MLTFFSLFCCSIRRHRLCTYANHCFSPVVKFRSEVQQKKKKKRYTKYSTQHQRALLFELRATVLRRLFFFLLSVVACFSYLAQRKLLCSATSLTPPPCSPSPEAKGFFFVQVKAASFLFCTVAHIFLCCFSFPLFLSSCYCCCCCEILARPHHDIVSPRLFLPSAPLFHRQLKF